MANAERIVVELADELASKLKKHFCDHDLKTDDDPSARCRCVNVNQNGVANKANTKKDR